MSVVKICGIREPEHALVAQQYGADFIGFVFVNVPRRVTTDIAQQIVQQLESTGLPVPRALGLFVDAEPDDINVIADQVGLAGVQLCGDEDPAIFGQLNRPGVKAIRIPSDADFDRSARLVDRYLDVPNAPAAVQVDTHVSGHYGGTGVVGNWELAARLSARFPVVLAGGLSPVNVGTAISQVHPIMVDVSSGVETDKRKDVVKIRKFIEASRRDFDELSNSQQVFLQHFDTLVPRTTR